MSNTTATAFGNEIEIDDVLYISEDFLRQYPDYLDTTFDAAKPVGAKDDLVQGPEEGIDTPSLYKSQIRVNGRAFVAMPALMANPNYLELKYNLGQEASLPEFISNRVLETDGDMSFMRRRRTSAPDSTMFRQKDLTTKPAMAAS
uniref:Uncharacterized protein n=1 Tax=Candidatus Kentrum sp. UNK TaxID=2126344 RepID=A0A451ALG1_9GAMM|nr:MAG: hypothetical protein BECKUNK1418G_GA0071005_111110 [Candidatus Kentron sp. UNK]VFK72246.1 MAG: hypothetical protein BECKUNK1418H_GA0071006_110310 [Candidatus Kentron sp. UNK]